MQDYIREAEILNLKKVSIPLRKHGPLKCPRLHFPILLLNGDAVVCCTDFGMRYILGNLLISEYNRLFES